MYQIELREYPLIGFAAHAYWVFYAHGELVGELHGLATDRSTGAAKAIGTRRDQLRAWRFPSPAKGLERPGARGGLSGFYDIRQASQVVFESVDDESCRRWNAANLAAQALNDANVQYRLFGGARIACSAARAATLRRATAIASSVRLPKSWASIRRRSEPGCGQARTRTCCRPRPMQASMTAATPRCNAKKESPRGRGLKMPFSPPGMWDPTGRAPMVRASAHICKGSDARLNRGAHIAQGA